MSIIRGKSTDLEDAGDVNRDNDNDHHRQQQRQQVEETVFTDTIENEVNEDAEAVPQQQQQRQHGEEHQCRTPSRDILEMPSILTPMLRREQRVKDQAGRGSTNDQLVEQTQPQVKTTLRTSEKFRASPILKNASRDGGITAVEEECAQHRSGEGYQDRSKTTQQHSEDDFSRQVQRPTPQKLIRRTAAIPVGAATNQEEGYAHYPYQQQFAAPHEYDHPQHPYMSNGQEDASESGSNSSSKQQEAGPNIISPHNPYPISHPGYNRYHQYSYAGPPPHHEYYGDRPPAHHRTPAEGTPHETYDPNSSHGRGRGGAPPPPPSYWNSGQDCTQTPPRRARSYESSSSSTGLHYSPMKAPAPLSSDRESPSGSRMEGYQKSDPNGSGSGSVWKPRVSEYPSPPRVTNSSSWDYGEPPTDFHPSTPYSGPPPPAAHFSPASGGVHYTTSAAYLPSPRGGWDINNRSHSHLPLHASPYRSLGSSRSWDSDDYALLSGTSAFSKHGSDHSRQQQQQQLLPKSSSSPEGPDRDGITEEEQVPTHSIGASGSSNRAPKYTYTFSGSFGASFDHEDPTAVTGSAYNTKPSNRGSTTSSSTMGPPPRPSEQHSNATAPFPHHYPMHPAPPPGDSWYSGSGGYPPPPHHHDLYAGPPPMHFNLGANRGGMVNGRMIWGGPMQPRGGPHQRPPEHMAVTGNYPLSYPKVTPPNTAMKKKINRLTSPGSAHPPSSSTLPLAAQYAAAVEFTKARLPQLLVLTAPPGKNSTANAQEFPPVIMLPPTPNILVDEIRSNDVLLGRGGGTNTQAGNRRFRGIVNAHQPIYLAARRKEKPLIARCIVEWIREQGGKFLKKDEVTGKHYDVGCERAEAKTSQALREGLDVRATKNATGGTISVTKGHTTGAMGETRPPLVSAEASGAESKDRREDPSINPASMHMESHIHPHEHMHPPDPRGWGGEVGAYGQPPLPPGYYPHSRHNLYDSSRRIRNREEVPHYHTYPPHYPGYHPPYGPPTYYGTPVESRSPKRIKWATPPSNDHKPSYSFPPVPNVLSDEDKILFKEFSPPPPSSDKNGATLVAPSYDQGEASDI